MLKKNKLKKDDKIFKLKKNDKLKKWRLFSRLRNFAGGSGKARSSEAWARCRRQWALLNLTSRKRKVEGPGASKLRG